MTDLTISSSNSKLKSTILQPCNDKSQFIITCIYPHQNILQELENTNCNPSLDFIIWLSYYSLTKRLYTTKKITIKLVCRRISPLFSGHYNNFLRKQILLKFHFSMYILGEEDYCVFYCCFSPSSLLVLQSTRQSEWSSFQGTAPLI